MKPEAATQQFAITRLRPQDRCREPAASASNRRARRSSRTSRARSRRRRSRRWTATSPSTSTRPAQPSRVAAQAEQDRRTEWYHHPITALHAATTPATTVSNVRTIGTDVRQADFTSGDKRWTMTIDAAGLPLSISSRTAHPNLGDVVMTTTFADYQDTNGIKLPARLTGKVDEFTTWEINATRQSVDADLGDLAAPAAVAAKPRAARPAERHGPIARQGRVAARRTVASQRLDRVRRSPDADRRAAKRGADARGDRQGEGDRAEQVAQPSWSPRIITSITPPACAPRCTAA